MAPHTSTEQWQSFEMRMRQRRAERCLLRAEVALEAGFPDDAREAFAEARSLNSSIGEFEVLQTVVRERQEAFAREHRPPRVRRTGASGSLAVAVIVGSLWMSPPVPGSRFPVPGSGFPVPGSGFPVPGSGFPVPSSGSLVQGSVVPPPSEPRVPTSALRATAGKPNPEPRVPTSAIGATAGKPNPEPRVDREPEVASIPVLTNRVDLSPINAQPAPAVPEPPPSAPVQPLAEAPPSPASTPVVDEGPRVRAALARYEAAYSALSVSAAQAVWPAVNARSLARAFDGLESQRLSLGQCAVAIDGASARADCNGTATWRPKIGGGTRTEPRNWRFELRNAGGEWQIVRADAR